MVKQFTITPTSLSLLDGAYNRTWLPEEGFIQQVLTAQLAWTLSTLLGATKTTMNKTVASLQEHTVQEGREMCKWKCTGWSNCCLERGVLRVLWEHTGGVPRSALKIQGRFLSGEDHSSALNTKLYHSQTWPLGLPHSWQPHTCWISRQSKTQMGSISLDYMPLLIVILACEGKQVSEQKNPSVQDTNTSHTILDGYMSP